jgi:hypothetical protein
VTADEHTSFTDWRRINLKNQLQLFNNLRWLDNRTDVEIGELDRWAKEHSPYLTKNVHKKYVDRFYDILEKRVNVAELTESELIWFRIMGLILL